MDSIEKIKQIINARNQSITTPFYLFDELAIENNYNLLRSMLGETKCNYLVAYSIKTNPLDSILEKLKACGGWAEATSIHEIQLAEKFKFPQIIFNGIYKSDEEMEYAAQIGAIIVLDGLQQISRIDKIANKNKKPVNVGIRISSYPILNDNGIRFGIYADDLELMQLIKSIASHKNINFCCLHMHLGTNICDPILYRLSLEKLYHISNIVKCFGVDIHYFDIGGGMPAHLDNKWITPFQNGICSFRDLISDPKKTIIIEPGRALVESAGFIVTKVVDIRKRIDIEGEDVVVDVGTNSFMGEGIFHTIHDCYGLQPQHNGDTNKYRLVGSLCSSDDIILNSFAGGRMDMNDLVMISNVGAYDFSTAYKFSRNFPQIYVLKKNGELKCVR